MEIIVIDPDYRVAYDNCSNMPIYTCGCMDVCVCMWMFACSCVKNIGACVCGNVYMRVWVAKPTAGEHTIPLKLKVGVLTAIQGMEVRPHGNTVEFVHERRNPYGNAKRV